MKQELLKLDPERRISNVEDLHKKIFYTMMSAVGLNTLVVLTYIIKLLTTR